MAMPLIKQQIPQGLWVLSMHLLFENGYQEAGQVFCGLHSTAFNAGGA
jgi:hypothetical protein